ncbi:hypothetical protein UPYG_G00005270 [Umbra pygmaea]|uniref:Neugrin n=1 Tax=Umbra pygmaea TaxID=75934 RepID=A0ABD0XH96_UMBPY
MAIMSLKMVSLIASRLGKLSNFHVKCEVSSTWSFMVSAKRNSSRHANRDANKEWFGQGKNQTHEISANRDRRKERFKEEDPDMDDVDDKLQAVLSEERKRQRRLKYHIIKRQMSESGAPERKLTWDAMEQIRYLKQELPGEWTVDRLAEGFSVHRSVILRVLRSRFTPPLERRAKQDATVLARLGQQALPGEGDTAGRGRQLLPGGGGTVGKGVLNLPGGPGRSQLSAGEGAGGPGRPQLPGSALGSSTPTMLISLQSQSLKPREDSAQLFSAWHNRHTSVQQCPLEAEESISKHNELETDKEEDQLEEWDGRVFSDQELEELMRSTKPTSVIQMGKDFFDSEGNFLYRI